jgi:hypothetical protein
MSLNAAGDSALHIGFNQDFGCFAMGMENGFRIYNCEPFKETFRRGTRLRVGVPTLLALFV